MNQKVIISLVYMGVCVGLSLVQNILNTFYYKEEITEIVKSLGMLMPIYFLAPYLTELVWKDNPNHIFFQKVFYRILVFSGMFIVVSAMVQFGYNQIWYSGMDISSFFMNMVYSVSAGVLRGCMYYVVRICLVENKSVEAGPSAASDIIDR